MKRLIVFMVLMQCIAVPSSIARDDEGSREGVVKTTQEITIVDELGEPVITFQGKGLVSTEADGGGTVSGRITAVVMSRDDGEVPVRQEGVWEGSVIVGYEVGDTALMIADELGGVELNEVTDSTSLTIEIGSAGSLRTTTEAMRSAVLLTDICNWCMWCSPCQANWEFWTCMWATGGKCSQCVLKPC